MYNICMLKISKVTKNQIGYELGFEKGDIILEFDGFPAVDILDYTYFDYKEKFSIKVLTKQGKTLVVEVEKEVNETLGLSFYSDNLDLKTCYNNCIFCFVDQMPKGLRNSLYVKDDDYRQSFLTGNFVTLTNVTDLDIERIIRLKLSPLYVSVQVTDSEVRKKMLNNKNAGDILDKLKKLTDNGIKIETQIVLVKGVNDGAILEKSIKELYSLKPNLLSVAVVPCGVTKYREGLTKIDDITPEYAKCVIEEVKLINAELKENFALLADEFYFKAGVPLEEKETYGNFTQIGNGVGGATKFLEEFNSLNLEANASGSYLLITGTSAKDYVITCAKKVESLNPNLKAQVLAVKNDFFGETVNCTGLLTAGDIINAVKNFNGNFDCLVLPNICLKQDEDVFLDNITLKQFKKAINKPIIITDGSAESFVDALILGSQIRKI